MGRKKTVLVCGDLVWDTHIARLPYAGYGYDEPHVHTQLTNRYGGAWYLHGVIKNALDAHNDFVKGLRRKKIKTKQKRVEVRFCVPARPAHADIESKTPPSGIAKGFSVWKWFEGNKKPAGYELAKGKDGADPALELKWPKNEPAEPGAWRVVEFLGCQGAASDKRHPCPIITPQPRSIDLLVIDDLGLGFARNDSCWPKSMGATGQIPKKIVIKATPPFESKLWQRLLQPEWASRTTVVVSVAGLREVGADISRGMSWDRAFEDIRHAFERGGAGWPLRRCHRVVVTFGRSGAAVFSRVARSGDPDEQSPEELQFERLLFDPLHLEDTWSKQFEGTTFGTGSVMTAAMACHELLALAPSAHISVGRGLTAARQQHRCGAGPNPDSFDDGPAKSGLFTNDPVAKPWSAFKSAFARELLDAPVLVSSFDAPSLLTDSVGVGVSFLTVAAEDIVRGGHKRPLDAVPRLEIGKHVVVDREEIENLNTVRRLIDEYRDGDDPRPLSIAVFGAPGAGKGFAIKKLAEEIFGEERATLDYNLSQFRSVEDLHEAFHEVRDKSVKRQLPLVFWDEFDSKCAGVDLGWLKEFLAPMQDANFTAMGKSHPFGQCIFIFAGGTCETFSSFDRSMNADEQFINAKGPDFVSRLRGYVNVKGPNPSPRHPGEHDEVHLIRRALMLRSLIDKHHKSAIRADTKELKIDPRVLAAFLGVSRYRHGARSMEAIVSLSHLRGKSHFGPSELPPNEVIGLHVTDDFVKILSDATHFWLAPEELNDLARAIHEGWLKKKKGEGYRFGETRDDSPKHRRHPLVVPWNKLSESQKDDNRLPARLALLRLQAVGFRIEPADLAGAVSSKVGNDLLLRFAQSEHRRWMRQKLLSGVAFAKQTSDELLLHHDICRFTSLKPDEQKLDREIITAIQNFLKGKKLAVIKGAPRSPMPRA